jgi:hypothetical protein
MKRLLALVAGGLGLRALLKRRSRPALSPSPAEDLRAKLAQTKAQEPEPEPVQPEPQPETVEGRRANVHAKARQAIDDLGKS